MPGGPAPLGFAYFAAVKFAGYTCAAWALNRSYKTKENNIWKVGAALATLVMPSLRSEERRVGKECRIGCGYRW
jgi:hypothetical protein